MTTVKVSDNLSLSEKREGSSPYGEDAPPSRQPRGGFVRPMATSTDRIEPGLAQPDASMLRGRRRHRTWQADVRALGV